MRLIDVGEIMKQARRDCRICCEKIEQIITTNKSNAVPAEFVARTLDGKEITGETRDKLYDVMDNSIDKFLESEEAHTNGD